MNMRCLKILILYCVLCVCVVTAEKDDHKVNHHQEKSHASKHNDEKSHGKSHVLDRHKKTETRTHGGSHFQHVAYRDGNENQHCQVVCNNVTSSNITQLEILYNGSAGFVGFANESGHFAFIQDFIINVTVLFYGDTENAIVMDNTNWKFYILENSTENESLMWSSSKSDFKTFFKKAGALKNYHKLAKESGKCISSFDELCRITKRDFALMGGVPSEGNYTIYLHFISKLSNTLKFIFKGEGSFYVKTNIMRFLNLNLAFAEILSDSECKELESADLKLNLTLIYGADSGVKAFVALLAQIGTHVDLTKVLGNDLTSPEKVLEWLEKISCESDEGDDGIITVIITIIRTLSGHGSITQVIDVISHYNPGGSNSSIAEIIDEALDVIENQNRAFNNSAAFRGIVTVLKALNDHNCVFKSINISDIITLLTSRNPITIMQTLIRIFSRMIGSEGFVQYIQGFLANLNSTSGLAIIARLFPGVDPSSVVHNIQSVLSHIPFLGNIFNSSIANGFNISSIVQSNPISGAIQNLTGSGLGGGIVDGFRNASSGVVHGVENAVHGFLSGVGGLFGSGNQGTSPPPPSSSPPATSGSPKPVCSNPDGTTSCSFTTSPTSSKHEGTEVASSESTISTTAASSTITTNSPVSAESTITSTSAESSTITTNSTGPTTQGPILRKAHNHNLQEKKDAQHLHASNKHGHINYKHNVHEKDHHSGHFEHSNRNQHLHPEFKKQEKKFSEKNHNKVQEKKHGDHSNNHN